MNAGAGELGRINVPVVIDTSRISQGIKAATDQIQGQLGAAGDKMQSIGKGLMKGLTVPIAAAGAAVIKFGFDFDKAMTESIAIMGDVSKEMKDKLGKTAIEVSKQTKFSATEAAQGYYYLASAGLDASQSIASLPLVARFAQAGVMDLAKATSYLADAQSALGLKSADAAENMKNMARVADVLAMAAIRSNADVDQFSQALTNKAAGALRNFNKPMEEGVAVLAAFADQGRKGLFAGEALSIILSQLPALAKKNARDFDQLGIAIFDNAGKMRNLADIIANFEEKTGQLTDAEKASFFTKLSITEALGDNIRMLMGTSAKIRQYQKDLENAQGATDEIAKKQMTSLANKFIRLKNVLVGIGLESFGPMLEKYVKPALDKAADALIRFGDVIARLTPEQQTFIVGAAALAAALGPVIWVAGGLVAALGSVVGILPALSLPLAGLVGVGGAVAGMVTGVLGASFTALAALVAPVIPVIGGFGFMLAMVLAPAFSAAGAAVAAMAAPVLKIGAIIAGPFISAFTAIGGVMLAILSPIGRVASILLGPLMAAFSGLLGVGGSLLTLLGGPLVLAFVAVGAAAAYVTTHWDAVKKKFSELTAAFTEGATDWASIWSSVKTSAGEAFSKVAKFASEMWEKMAPYLSKIAEFFIAQFGKIAGWVNENMPLIQAAMGNVWKAMKWFADTVAPLFSASWEAIKIAVSGAVDIVLGVLKTLMQLITGDFSGAWESAKGVVIDAVEAILGVVDKLLGGVTETLGRLIGATKEKAQAVADAITSPFAWAYDELVGHSIVPDMVRDIGKEFDKLLTTVSVPTDSAVNAMLNAWEQGRKRAMDISAEMRKDMTSEEKDALRIAQEDDDQNRRRAMDIFSNYRSMQGQANPLLQFQRDVAEAFETVSAYSKATGEAMDNSLISSVIFERLDQLRATGRYSLDEIRKAALDVSSELDAAFDGAVLQGYFQAGSNAAMRLFENFRAGVKELQDSVDGMTGEDAFNAISGKSRDMSLLWASLGQGQRDMGVSSLYSQMAQFVDATEREKDALAEIDPVFARAFGEGAQDELQRMVDLIKLQHPELAKSADLVEKFVANKKNDKFVKTLAAMSGQFSQMASTVGQIGNDIGGEWQKSLKAVQATLLALSIGFQAVAIASAIAALSVRHFWKNVIPIIGQILVLISDLIGLFVSLGDSAGESAEDTKTIWEKTMDALNSAIDDFGSKFTDTLVDMVRTGKAQWGDLTDYIIEELLRISIQYSITEPLTGLMKIGLGKLFAKGGAFADGVQVMAKGRVLNKPTFFPMKSGMGLAGEAGPEAVMPLKRLADGSLGVMAEGAGGGSAFVNVEVNNYSSAEVTTTERTGANGMRNVLILMREAWRKDVSYGQNDEVLGNVYSIKRKPRFRR